MPTSVEILKNFFTKNKAFLDKNDFDTLYQERFLSRDIQFTSELTAILYKSGINPIPYFKETIPRFFMFQINEYMDSLPSKITFTPNIKTIGYGAFQSCPWLEEVTFNNKDLTFSRLAFDGMDSLVINYPGTKGEFSKCKKEAMSFHVENLKLVCSDGIFTI